MVRAGITFCPKCGNVFSKDAYFYKNTMNTWGVLLQRSFRGYELTPYAVNGDLSDAIPVELEHIPVTPTPDCIEVRLPTQEGKTEYWYRCCSQCKEVNTILPGAAGTVPTYVILMAGNPGTGKSSLCTTMSSIQELAPFNNEFGAPYILDAAQNKDDRVEMVKNSGTDMAESNWMHLKDPKTGELKAMILLRDLAGELYTASKRTELIRYFSGKNGYEPDGIIFVTPYNDENCINAYNSVKNYFLPTLPVAFVATFLDELQNDRGYEKTRAVSGEPVKLGLPVLRELTGKMDEESTRKRIALENMLFRRLTKQHRVGNDKTELRASKLSSMLSMQKEGNAAGFLVQSWSPSANGSDENDAWRKRQNALDPLIWMLMKIGLLQWTTTGGYDEN